MLEQKEDQEIERYWQQQKMKEEAERRRKQEMYRRAAKENEDNLAKKQFIKQQIVAHLVDLLLGNWR